jgi:hypothetical protein
MSPVKEEAKRLIDELPDSATWDDVMYAVYVRDTFERGLAQEPEALEHEEVERRIAEFLRTP